MSTSCHEKHIKRKRAISRFTTSDLCIKPLITEHLPKCTFTKHDFRQIERTQQC
jgi:hypothetical protein